MITLYDVVICDIASYVLDVKAYNVSVSKDLHSAYCQIRSVRRKMIDVNTETSFPYSETIV